MSCMSLKDKGINISLWIPSEISTKCFIAFWNRVKCEVFTEFFKEPFVPQNDSYVFYIEITDIL